MNTTLGIDPAEIVKRFPKMSAAMYQYGMLPEHFAMTVNLSEHYALCRYIGLTPLEAETARSLSKFEVLGFRVVILP